MPIQPGLITSQTVPLRIPDRQRSVDFELAIERKDKSVSAFARNIPDGSHVHVLGVSHFGFMAIIDHPDHTGHLAPTCELRCTPTEQPIAGPGCVTCKKHGLSFKVCC
jgi:hypothetical protein